MNAPERQETASSPDPIRGRWVRRLRRAFVLYVLVPYLAVTLIFVVFQRKLTYRPTVAKDLRAATVGLETESVHDVQIQTPDGNVLNGWLLKARRDRGHKPPLLLYFPGHSLNRHERIDDLREVVACGFDTLIFDYRGYGDSSGSPSEQALTSDARLVWERARDYVEGDESRIVIFGESLGGAVALSLWSTEEANPPQPAALILNSTFASWPRTVAWHYPLFPFKYLLLDRWPSIERIRSVQTPVIVFHGTADDMVPIEQARELAHAAADARLVEIPGGTHNEIPRHRLRTELDRLRASISENDHRP